MTPSVNFICPCCLHKGRLTDELFDTIMQVVSEDYGSDRHNIEWASHFTTKDRQARSVVVYLLKHFSGAMNKDLNRLFHWADASSNATIRIAQVADLYEEDPGFARRLDLIVEKCREKILNNSQPHAICA
jgi:hypothetical protein